MAARVLADARPRAPALSRSRRSCSTAPSSPSTRSTRSRGRSPRSSPSSRRGRERPERQRERTARTEPPLRSSPSRRPSRPTASTARTRSSTTSSSPTRSPGLGGRAAEDEERGGRRGARGPRRESPLLVRARDRRRQDRRRRRLRRGLAHRRGPDPHPPPQPRRPVHRRDLRPRLQGAPLAAAPAARTTTPTARSRSRPTSGSSATRSQISDAYSIVICDEAHTALGEKTSACIRDWPGPVFIGMTATGALIARHVADLFPTQTSRFDLAQAARRGVIAPLRCLRIPPGPGVRTLAKVPLRRGEVDQDFDQEELAKLLDQGPFNVAVADLYRSRFRNVPGRRLHRRRQAREQRRRRASRRRHQRPGGLRRDAEARAGRDPRRVRARRGRRALQRDAARRGLELAAGDDLHAPGPDRLAPRLPAARRPRDPPRPRQGGRPGDRLRPPRHDLATRRS